MEINFIFFYPQKVWSNIWIWLNETKYQFWPNNFTNLDFPEIQGSHFREVFATFWGSQNSCELAMNFDQNNKQTFP